MSNIESYQQVLEVLKQAETTLSAILNKPVKVQVLHLSPKVKTAKKLQTIIAGIMGVPWEKITGDAKDEVCVTGRQLYCYYCQRLFPEKSKTQISIELKYSDHTGVISSLKRINNLLETNDPYMTAKVKKINEKIYSYEV
jgi:chromosomal replication initiation ATPase DnaA